ncbi:hypothetical protein GH714_006715 [Hevea brasiliensis]|uniref:Pentatricopeptide repeat-containing protein n=1 Tax=Hevea brasiliensis TaxID=3981 RepID=A0A6A6N1F6_HEVBR|nr:hypothetical protein GH714_006715 [Hevea brasiliensis]
MCWTVQTTYDLSVEGNARAEFLSSSPRLSLGNYFPNTAVPTASSNQIVSSPYLENRSSLSTEDQVFASQYVGGGSRIPTQKPYFDPYLDTGLPSSSRYAYPNYPINTSYPDLMPRMPVGDALSASVPATDSLQVTTDDLENEEKDTDLDLCFQSCAKLPHAKCLHTLLLVSGRAQNILVSTKLVNLYSYLGEIPLSRRTFDQMPKKNVYTWNSMISAYVRHGRFNEAVCCFHQFLWTSGLQPDFYTFPPVVKACQNLLDGKKIHCSILKLGFEWDVFVAASLIHMYSRFRLVGAARKLFDDMPSRDRGSWNAMISGYCQNGNAAKALDVADEMRLQGCLWMLYCCQCSSCLCTNG